MPPTIPGAGTLWALRILAAAGLGIALFLTGIHIAAALEATRIQGPYCRVLSFFDCDTVLNSEWATWFGLPVPVLGAAAYLVLLGALLAPLHQSNRVRASRTWLLLCATSLAIAGAAGWFIYLQTVELGGALCLWCMAEHAIGLTLFVLIWLHAFAARVLRSRQVVGVIAAGLAGVASLIAGQHLDTHNYLRSIGPVELDAGGHLLLGSPSAANLSVEVIDYTCPRCKRLARLTREAREMLGPRYAFVILTAPLHPQCNKYYAEDFQGEVDERHRFACELAELAHAVWRAEPSAFAEYHDWLFEQQESLGHDTAPAHERAVQIVGSSSLEQALAEVRAAGLIARDVQIAVDLGVGQLPGLFANGNLFVAIPESADTLAQQIHAAFQQPR